MQPTALAHAHLIAARHLIEQAVQTAADHIGTDLQPALAAVDREIEALGDLVTAEHYMQLAARLGPGWSWSAE